MITTLDPALDPDFALFLPLIIQPSTGVSSAKFQSELDLHNTVQAASTQQQCSSPLLCCHSNQACTGRLPTRSAAVAAASDREQKQSMAAEAEAIHI